MAPRCSCWDGRGGGTERCHEGLCTSQGQISASDRGNRHGVRGLGEGGGISAAGFMVTATHGSRAWGGVIDETMKGSKVPL